MTNATIPFQPVFIRNLIRFTYKLDPFQNGSNLAYNMAIWRKHSHNAKSLNTTVGCQHGIPIRSACSCPHTVSFTCPAYRLYTCTCTYRTTENTLYSYVPKLFFNQRNTLHATRLFAFNMLFVVKQFQAAHYIILCHSITIIRLVLEAKFSGKPHDSSC